MNDPRPMKAALVPLSKFLSKVLRHQPELIGVELDPQGWIEVDLLLAKCAEHGKKALSRETLEEIVSSNDKQRFAFSEDRRRIRANQGHSVEVDLELPTIEPPETLFHGTATRHLPSIMESGLLPGTRQQVHLSADRETAWKVGSRHGKPVILRVLALQLHAAGGKFSRSANGVWLVDAVPPQYLVPLDGVDG